jgi:hypothetical protein
VALGNHIATKIGIMPTEARANGPWHCVNFDLGASQ